MVSHAGRREYRPLQDILTLLVGEGFIPHAESKAKLMSRSYQILYFVCFCIKKVLDLANENDIIIVGGDNVKILNFGSCNIDYVYSLDHIVEVGETETTHKREIFPGGKGLNQSIAAAKAGAAIFHAGCVGCDGELLTDILTENGVDISYMSKTDGTNGHAVIQVSSAGENSIFLYPGSNEMVTKEYIDSVLENFEQDDIILLQNEISNVDYIVEKAYQKKLCIILNPSPFNEEMKKIDFGKLSYIILNEVEAKAISGCDVPEEGLSYIRSRYPGLKVMLTLGCNGCIYMDEAHELYQPAFEVEAVDTTAAGDTFTGYFIAELSRGTEYREILKISSAASAIAVSRKGAAPSIPDRTEVLSSLDSLKENKSSGKSNVIRKRIEAYIEENIASAKLEELSAMLGYSAVYTGSLVKKLMGESFSKAVQSKRCSIAAQKLLNTDESIEEIIKAVGYENESFFRKVFKEKYGKNPLEFRKMR